MNKVKNFIGTKYPKFFSLLKNSYYFSNKILLSRKPHEIIFNKIYKINAWGDIDTVSGAGSNLENTKTIRKDLPLLLNEFNIDTILDIPCGDFYWMNKTELSIANYIGADIIKEMIKSNNEKYSNNSRKFVVLDLIKNNLPQVDLIFCRDCLPHLPFIDIISALKNIKKSGSKYLLTSTYINQIKNTDIIAGKFRRLNFQISPFNFPPPVKIIDDICLLPGGELLEDKSMALWKISDLNI